MKICDWRTTALVLMLFVENYNSEGESNQHRPTTTNNNHYMARVGSEVHVHLPANSTSEVISWKFKPFSHITGTDESKWMNVYSRSGQTEDGFQAESDGKVLAILSARYNHSGIFRLELDSEDLEADVSIVDGPFFDATANGSCFMYSSSDHRIRLIVNDDASNNNVNCHVLTTGYNNLNKLECTPALGSIIRSCRIDMAGFSSVDEKIHPIQQCQSPLPTPSPSSISTSHPHSDLNPVVSEVRTAPRLESQECQQQQPSSDQRLLITILCITLATFIWNAAPAAIRLMKPILLTRWHRDDKKPQNHAANKKLLQPSSEVGDHGISPSDIDMRRRDITQGTIAEAAEHIESETEEDIEHGSVAVIVED